MSAKVCDKKGRWRNKIVSFRMSPEEDAELETAVSLSGLSKQDYIISRLQNRDIVVVGNPRVHKALRNQMAVILEELQRISSSDTFGDELLHTIRLIATTMNGLKDECSTDALVGGSMPQ
ncbi:MAG: hypothetical protein FWD44_03400 [Oscillospiraceae bacterium]|nr:hypothetical protein [Oscillospiraceae bacterium]